LTRSKAFWLRAIPYVSALFVLGLPLSAQDEEGRSHLAGDLEDSWSAVGLSRAASSIGTAHILSDYVAKGLSFAGASTLAFGVYSGMGGRSTAEVNNILYGGLGLMATGMLTEIVSFEVYQARAIEEHNRWLAARMGDEGALPGRGQALMYSVVLPGLGQAYRGEIGHGLVTGVVTLLSLFRLGQSSSSDQPVWGAIFGSLYGLNLYDAYNGPRSLRPFRASMALIPSSQSPALALRWSY
jgi:hypothetical protein